MTKEELAARLNGNPYGDECMHEDAAAAKAAGLVVVYGASDDLMEFEGAIRDEVGWGEDGYSWTYRTDIPHATFEIVEDGEPYCRGIVFAIVDLEAAPK